MTRLGAIAWIVGPVQFFVVLPIVRYAWRSNYSWLANPLSDLGAVRCQRLDIGDPPWPRYVCSPLHTVIDASDVVVGILFAAGVLLLWHHWGTGIAAHCARVLLIVGAAGTVLVGLSPEDVNLGLHVTGAILGIGAANIGFVATGLATRTGVFGRLRPLTLSLSVLELAASCLLATRHTPVTGYGGMEALAVFPLRIWMVIAGCCLLLAGRRAIEVTGAGGAAYGGWS